MAIHLSALAKQTPGVRNPKLGKTRDPFGLLLHTTGGGVTPLAKKKKQLPVDVAIRIYIGSQNGSNGYMWGGPGYVLEHNGTLHQIAPDNILTNHCGGDDRAKYVGGSWIKEASPAALAKWHAQWGPRYKAPNQLYPSKSPNTDYVGVEMIPCGDGFGIPMRPGLRFSKEQHDMAIDLGREMAKRHEWPAGWQRGSRLVGHEDVQLLNRMDKNGGWDPGWLREKPYFDFDYVRNNIG